MAEPMLGMMPAPRSPLQTAPPPVPTARPQVPPEGPGPGPGMDPDTSGAFLAKGKQAMRLIVEMATLRRDKATQLSAIAGGLTDLIEEDAQESMPDDGTEEAMGMPGGAQPMMPRSPLHSPTEVSPVWPGPSPRAAMR